MRVVLRRTVVDSGDRCFDNLSGSHYKSESSEELLLVECYKSGL